MNSSFNKAGSICANHDVDHVSGGKADTPHVSATFYDEWPYDELQEWVRRTRRRRRRCKRKRIKERRRRALTSSRLGRFCSKSSVKVVSSYAYKLNFRGGRELGFDEDEFSLFAESYEVRERLLNIERESFRFREDSSLSNEQDRWADAYAGIDDPAFVPLRQRSLSDEAPPLPEEIRVPKEYEVETVDESDCLPDVGLEPHSFLDTISNIRESAETLSKLNQQLTAFKSAVAYKASDDDSVVENIICRIEDIAALILTLSGVTTLASFAGAIFQYLRTHYRGPVFWRIKIMIQEVLENMFCVRDGRVRDNDDDTAYMSLDRLDPHSDETLSTIKSLLYNWKLGRQSAFGKNMGNIISILVACGFSPEIMLGDDAKKKFKLFSPFVWSVQDRPLDFLEMVAETVIFFVERGVQALAQGDWSLLLCDDADMRNLDRLYTYFVAQVPLLEAGKLGSMLGSEELGITNEFDFQLHLEKLINTFGDMLRIEKNPVARGALTSKLVALTKVRSTLVAAQRSSPVRVKPFGVVVFGGSSIAKTNLSDVLIKVILSANGFPSSKEHITTINDLDKYMSDYKTSHTCITLDDFANAVSQTYEGSPLAKIIDILNNVPKAALKADVESKGNVMILPKLVMVTTNVKELLSHVFSNCPGAILRRFNYHLTATLKKEFVDPETGGFDPSKASDDLIPNYWDITVQHVQLVRNHKNAEMDTFKYETDMKDADIYQVIDFMVEKSRIHFSQQDKFVKHVETLFDSTLCEHCRDPNCCPKCDAIRLKNALRCPDCSAMPCVCENNEPLPEFGPMPLEIPFEDSEMPGLVAGHKDDDDSSYGSYGDDPAPGFVRPWLRELSDSESEYEPLEVQATEVENWQQETKAMRTWCKRERRDALRKFEEKLQHCLMFAKVNHPEDPEDPLCPKEVSLEQADEDWYILRQLKGARYVAEQAAASLSDVFSKHRETVTQVVLAGSATMLLIYGAIKMYGALRGITRELEDQGSNMQKPIPFEERTSEWLKPVFSHIPLQSASVSTTSDRLLENLGKRIAHLTVSSEGRIDARANIVPIWKNEWLMPAHMIRDGVFKVRIRTTPVDSAGLNFSEIVDESCWVKIPNTDFALIRLMKGGSNRDFVKFLAEKDFNGVNGMKAHSVIRNSDGETQYSFFPLLKKDVFTVAGVTYGGIAYNCPFPTYKGQCMMAAVVDSKQPFICGFHIAGKSGTSYGVLGTLTREQIEMASEQLQHNHPLVMHSDAHFNPSRYGVDVPVLPSSDPRHPINFMCVEDGEEPNLIIHGEHGGGVARFSSNVRTSVISEAVTEIGIPRVHGPPDHKNYNKHYQRELHQLAHSKGDIPPRLVLKALDDFSTKILDHLDENPDLKEMVHPMPNDYNLAGCDGIAYVDRVDLTTSAGFPLNKAKNTFIFPSDREVDGITEPLDVEEIKLWETVDQMEDALARGERIHAIHRANLKDEPVKYGKDKIRVFAGCEVAFTLLYRRHLLGFNRLVQKCPTVFETAVGINASGKEWDGFVKYISTFGENNVIDGDFKSFDKRMPPLISRATFEVAIKVCRACGYTERQINILRGIATEVCYPTYEYKGVFVTVHGGMPSGYPGTALQNGFATCLYIRLPFFRDIFPEGDERFHDYAKVGAYGDDHTIGVKDGCPLTMKLLDEVLGSFGIQYTAADKTKIVRDYDTLAQASFLKRGMRFDKDTQTYLAPLDEASIAKSLHNYIHRKNVPTTKEQIAADALVNALREYFQHGRGKYEDFLTKIPIIAEKAGILKYLPVLDSYDEALARYNGESDVAVTTFPDDSELECQMDDGEEGFDFPGFDFEFDPFYDGEYFPAHRIGEQHGRPPQDTVFEMDDHFLLAEDITNFCDTIADTIFGTKHDGYQRKWGALGSCVVRVAVLSLALYNFVYCPLGRMGPPKVDVNSFSGRMLTESLIYVFNTVDHYNGVGNTRLTENTKESQGCLQTKAQPSTTGCGGTPLKSASMGEDKPKFVTHPRLPSVFEFEDEDLEPHMDFVKEHGYCVNPPPAITQEQNVMFADANPAMMSCVESEYEEIRRMVDNDDATLANFFRRPVLIDTITWQYGSTTENVLNPWQAYFANRRVANRIANFAQIRSKLHLKFVINGSPFYYGRMMVCYQPLEPVDQFTSTRFEIEADWVERSQQPHVFLDPTPSQGAEMVLPYVYHLNNCSVPGNQMFDLGILRFIPISPLKHTQGTANFLDIQVFAWAEDLHLSIPTSAVPSGLVPQADDEYGNGPVSRPSSVLARVAGSLASAPWIGPYAKATQIGASAVSSIASTFGYSKPVIIADQTMTIMRTPNIANSSGGDTSVKLSLDPKQELAVDPRTVGLGATDEMTIKSIATRESYLTTFNWSTDTGAGLLLWNSAVTPTLWREYGTTQEIHLPAMCFAALPFKYWRGNINFRFMVVCSSFHRGRLRIVYEPGDLPVSQEWNTNYTSVIDIAETKDFSISVGWGSTPAILNHTNPVDNYGTEYFGDTIIPPTDRDDRNGVIGVYAVTPLTNPTPLVDNDIKIHVFVSAGDNFEVFVPDSKVIKELTWMPVLLPGGRIAGPSAQDLEPQADDEAIVDNTTEPAQVELSSPFDMLAPKMDVTDHLTDVHIGESIVSFRNCLKRYNWSRTIPIFPTNGQIANFVGTQVASNFPHYRGYTPAGLGIHRTSTNEEFNYTGGTLMNYLTPAFVCRRGGIRWKYLYTGSSNNFELFYVSRRSDDGGTMVDQYTTSPTLQRGAAVGDTFNSSNGAHNRAKYLSTLWEGANFAHRTVNPFCEIELPFHSNNRFSPAKRMDMRTSVIDKGRDNYYHAVQATTTGLTNSSPMPYIDGLVAAAEDFSLYFYTGPPIAYVQTTELLPTPKT